MFAGILANDPKAEVWGIPWSRAAAAGPALRMNALAQGEASRGWATFWRKEGEKLEGAGPGSEKWRGAHRVDPHAT
ncbi:MAG: hypothetical protein IPL47_14840 [Phyllobacteriaceae bacterium]|nr:hypothetical protein [Phyllobacteriaceae bacterium]